MTFPSITAYHHANELVEFDHTASWKTAPNCITLVFYSNYQREPVTVYEDVYVVDTEN